MLNFLNYAFSTKVKFGVGNFIHTSFIYIYINDVCIKLPTPNLTLVKLLNLTWGSARPSPSLDGPENAPF